MVPREGRYLGSLMVDVNEQTTHTYRDFGIYLYLAIENVLASYNGPYDHHHIHAIITIHWAHYAISGAKTTDNAFSASRIFTLGNDNPGTDTKLYLLPAQDYSPSVNPST